MVQGQGRIVKIERIQNSKLYEQYSARKKAMERASAGRQNERQLFHGCSDTAVVAINHGGFNRSYAGQHGQCSSSGQYSMLVLCVTIPFDAIMMLLYLRTNTVCVCVCVRARVCVCGVCACVRVCVHASVHVYLWCSHSFTSVFYCI